MAYGDDFSRVYALNYSPAHGLVVGSAVDGADGAAITSTSKILGPDSTVGVYIDGPKMTFDYIGTATVGGQFAGIVVYNPGTDTEYLLTNSALDAGKTVAVDPADDPIPGAKANFNVETDLPTSMSPGTGGITCFMAGTGISTPSGVVPVETLKAGDQVTLASGATASVVWLGRQSIVARFSDPMRSVPVRIKAHAIAPCQPERDLLVSPAHAIYVDGILVQAAALVNGVSIVRETQVPARFTYYHVELAEHGLLLAEGLPAESFINNAEDGVFDNWAERADVAIPEMDLPLAKSARQVPATVQARLAARASELCGTDLAIAA